MLGFLFDLEVHGVAVERLVDRGKFKVAFEFFNLLLAFLVFQQQDVLAVGAHLQLPFQIFNLIIEVGAICLQLVNFLIFGGQLFVVLCLVLLLLPRSLVLHQLLLVLF